jgi:hypothetical protein
MGERKAEGFWKFFFRVWKRLWKDAVIWARDNIGWAAMMAVLPPIVAYLRDPNQSVDWLLLRTTLWLYVAVLVVYIAINFFRSIWKLDTERAEAIGEIQHQIKLRDVEIRKQENRVSSADWKQLADRFDKVNFGLSAGWQQTQGKTIWTLGDQQLKSLCLLAGAMLLKSPYCSVNFEVIVTETDHVKRWLEFVKSNRTSTNVMHGTETLNDGSTVNHFFGSINDLARKSSSLCLECCAYET